MIRYLQHKEIDLHKWDMCIDFALNALPYAYSWYLDIAAEKKWDAMVLDDYLAVFPLPFKNRVLFRQVYQPFFVQQLGLFYRSEKSERRLSEFADALPAYFRKVRLQLNTANHLTGSGFKIAAKLTHHISLSDGYAAIRNNFNSNLVRNLKKANAQAFTITENISPARLIQFREEFLGKELKGKQNSADAARLKRIMQTAIRLDKGFIAGVEDSDGELLAAVFFLKSNKHLIYLTAVSAEKGKEKHAMAFLIDQILQRFAGAGFIFDFEGSMIPGVARFYKSFGAAEVKFQVIEK